MHMITAKLRENSPQRQKKVRKEEKFGLFDNDSSIAHLPSVDLISGIEDQAISDCSLESPERKFIADIKDQCVSVGNYKVSITGNARGLTKQNEFLKHILKVCEKDKISPGGEGQLKQAMTKLPNSR